MNKSFIVFLVCVVAFAAALPQAPVVGDVAALDDRNFNQGLGFGGCSIGSHRRCALDCRNQGFRGGYCFRGQCTCRDGIFGK